MRILHALGLVVGLTCLTPIARAGCNCVESGSSTTAPKREPAETGGVLGFDLLWWLRR